MRYLLLTLLLLVAPVRAAGVVVIGDSLSSFDESWPSHLVTHNKVLAQSGRKIIDFEIPRDLRAGRPYDTVVYFLGGNDMIQAIPKAAWQPIWVEHVKVLKMRGFRVIVLVPPNINRDRGGLRWTMWISCSMLKLECHNVPYSVAQTYDTIHPLPELSQEIGYFVQDILDNEVP